jgi:hypothetical protein
VIAISDFVAFVASLVTIGAGVAIVIRYFKDEREHHPLVIWGTAVGVIIVVLVAVVVSRITTITVAGRSSIPIPGLGNSSTPTATSTLTTQSAAATATAQATLVPPPNAATPSLLGSGTITLNHPLECAGCDEPIVPIVSSIAVNDPSMNSTWSFTFFNHSGATCDVTGLSMDLSDPQGHDYSATGGVTGGISGDIKPNQSLQGTTTFAFVPYHGVPYMVSAALHLYCYSYNHTYSQYQGLFILKQCPSAPARAADTSRADGG